MQKNSDPAKNGQQERRTYYIAIIQQNLMPCQKLGNSNFLSQSCNPSETGFFAPSLHVKW
jgi:hypothetical protein